MFEPLYTAAEMRRAEEGHDVDELMARAGRAVAEEALRRFPDARSFGAVCGKGANGGDGRIALEVLRGAGRHADEQLAGDVVVDALFGTGFRGEPRPEAAELIERMNGSGAPIFSAQAPVRPERLTPGFGRPRISISRQVKWTPMPSALPTASLPANRPA